jgi:hypothetical protein
MNHIWVVEEHEGDDVWTPSGGSFQTKREAKIAIKERKDIGMRWRMRVVKYVPEEK